MGDGVSTGEKVRAILRVSGYRPRLTAGIVVLSVAAATLEGVGLTFLIPIIQVAQSGGSATDLSGVAAVFARVYRLVGVPFTMETIIVGVTAVMFVRYTLSFLVAWLRAVLRTHYVRDLQTRAFDHARDAEVAYFDEKGSDEILNAIITQTDYVGELIRQLVVFLEQGVLALMYLSVAAVLAPRLTVFTGVLLGGITYLLRSVVEPGYTVGDRVAYANERVQAAVQAGTQGIRDVKLFGMAGELFADFRDAVEQYADASIALWRNQAAIDKSYRFLSAITVFLLIYVALTVTSLSLEALGVFLFAMFRLAPRVSNLNQMLYQIEGNLPHFVRTREFIDDLRAHSERGGGTAVPPETVETVAFEDVSFSYRDGEPVLRDLSFSFSNGEFVAFVGQSGAGKSTIVSLLARMYEPDAGEITADGVPIDEFDLRAWRSKLAVVRQNPHIFNDTLRYNLTIGNRDVSHAELDCVCDVAQVSEFLSALPEGYDTVLGDDGVQLSGGQRQRVALARALLPDADVLVLDEATSDLDSNLEADVHRAIETMDRDYAVLAIAHRLSTVTNADRIYTVEAGTITERGDHEHLLELGGTYAELYRIQS